MCPILFSLIPSFLFNSNSLSKISSSSSTKSKSKTLTIIIPSFHFHLMGKMVRPDADHHHHHSYSSSSTDSNTGSVPGRDQDNEFNTKDHFSIDLRLGLSNHHTCCSSSSSTSSPRGQYSEWPTTRGNGEEDITSSFVKVYMEGIPIGRKLDLVSLDGYHSLTSTLSQMFKTTLLCPDIIHNNSLEKCHILTYEDKEGDWMMVGDVPWEMFLSTAKRLKIVSFDRS